MIFLEDADTNTKVVAINSESANSRTAETVRSYVLLRGELNTYKVHPDAQLIP